MKKVSSFSSVLPKVIIWLLQSSVTSLLSSRSPSLTELQWHQLILWLDMRMSVAGRCRPAVPRSAPSKRWWARSDSGALTFRALIEEVRRLLSG
jgi:hypothetical protein